jgi:hypothetical protein
MTLSDEQYECFFAVFAGVVLKGATVKAEQELSVTTKVPEMPVCPR